MKNSGAIISIIEKHKRIATQKNLKYRLRKWHFRNIWFFLNKYPEISDQNLSKLIRLWWTYYVVAYMEKLKNISPQNAKVCLDYIRKTPILKVLKRIDNRN